MKLDLSTVFNKAARRVVQDIRDGIVSGRMLGGSSFTPNAPSTAQQKGFNKRLVGKGRSFISTGAYKISKASPSKQQAEITFRDEEKAKIAMYNQTPTGKGTISPKDAAIFYGISEDVSKEIEKDVDAYINRTIDKEFTMAGFKKI